MFGGGLPALSPPPTGEFNPVADASKQQGFDVRPAKDTHKVSPTSLAAWDTGLAQQRARQEK